MMKIVLCSTPLNVSVDRTKGWSLPVTPKIAIVSLMHWMSKFGYSGEFYDIDMLLPSEDEIYDYFKNKQPDIVGISAVVSGSYLQVKNLSKIIYNACPSTWIVVGGNMAVCANVILNKTEVDICVLGDGEKTWVELLEYVKRYGRERDIEKLLKIKGIAFLNNQGELQFTGYGEPIPDNEMPYSDYDILAMGLIEKPYLIDNYFREGKNCNEFKNDIRTYEPDRKPKLAMLWTSKGCTMRCTFCQRFCKGYHVFDLQELDKHLEELKNKYNVQFLILGDECFGANKKHSIEVAKLLKKHDMLWFAGGVRCTSFNLEDIKLLKEYGCVALKPGVESGSQKILDIMEKKFIVGNVLQFLDNTNQCNINSPIALCIGMPGETDDTIKETGRLLGEIARIRGVSPSAIRHEVFWALPLPGAPLYEYGQLQGVIGSSVDDEEEFLIKMTDKSAGKDNYINLTGVSNREAIFWDYLLYYESMRTYYSNPVKKAHITADSSNEVEVKVENIFTIKNAMRLLPTPISLLNKILCRSPIVAKIPRFIYYPVMRNLIYVEYIIRSILKSESGYGRHYRKPSIIKEAKSLRLINQQIRATLSAPKTITEKNQQLLRMGR